MASNNTIVTFYVDGHWYSLIFINKHISTIHKFLEKDNAKVLKLTESPDKVWYLDRSDIAVARVCIYNPNAAQSQQMEIYKRVFTVGPTWAVEIV